MPQNHEFEITSYCDENNKDHFSSWFSKLNTKSQDTIILRLARIKSGNFGDCKPVGENIHEIRIHINSGYRIYFTKEGRRLILLLCAGDKSSQVKDIKRAKEILKKIREK